MVGQGSGEVEAVAKRDPGLVEEHGCPRAKQAHRVLETLSEELKLRVYACSDDTVLSGWQSVRTSIKVIDEWAGELTAQDDNRLRRRYVNESFYAPKRCPGTLKLVYVESLRAAWLGR